MKESPSVKLTETHTVTFVNTDVLKVGQVIGFRVNSPKQVGTEVVDVYSEAVGVIERIWSERIEVLNLITGGHTDLWANTFDWREIEILSDAEHLLEAYKNGIC